MLMALLRGTDQRRLMAIARGGGPRSANDDLAVYCPLCNCRKSGCIDTPNGHDECCADDDCWCHDEDR